MQNRERFHAWLTRKPVDRAPFWETFAPWDQTLVRWRREGLPEEIDYHTYFGLDPWVLFWPYHGPLPSYPEEVVERGKDWEVSRDGYGRLRKRYRTGKPEEILKEAVTSVAEWEELARRRQPAWKRFGCGEERLKELQQAQSRGEVVVRVALEGFFWFPRTLLGIEPHLYAFYDQPELLHDMCRQELAFMKEMIRLFQERLEIDMLTIAEDLSFRGGPMCSPAQFDEFLLPYYEELTSFAREQGIRHIIVDTDGDFSILIPNFLKGGVDGFIPMEVQAGMEVTALQARYPDLKLIGGVNKLELMQGREGIDREIARLRPALDHGQYIPGCDHQVPPQVSLEDYRYYLARLREALQR